MSHTFRVAFARDFLNSDGIPVFQDMGIGMLEADPDVESLSVSGG